MKYIPVSNCLGCGNLKSNSGGIASFIVPPKYECARLKRSLESVNQSMIHYPVMPNDCPLPDLPDCLECKYDYDTDGVV